MTAFDRAWELVKQERPDEEYHGFECPYCGWIEDNTDWHFHDCPTYDDPLLEAQWADLRERYAKGETVEWERPLNPKLRAILDDPKNIVSETSYGYTIDINPDDDTPEWVNQKNEGEDE